MKNIMKRFNTLMIVAVLLCLGPWAGNAIGNQNSADHPLFGKVLGYKEKRQIQAQLPSVRMGQSGCRGNRSP